MRRTHLVAGFACALLLGAGLTAADEPKPDDASKQRLEFMKAKLDEVAVATEKAPDRPLVRTREPVLRYSNAARSIVADAGIFLWTAGERPAAAATLWIGTDGKAAREFVTLTDQPLRCTRDGKTVWSPRADGFARKPLPDAPKPAGTAALRLTQMRRQAERFAGTFELRSTRGRPEELRLLPQPIYRYTADKGAVEGTLFALAHGNDPEVLLVLEMTTQPADPPAWTYGIARMSSVWLKASLDKKGVWSADNYYDGPRTPETPYMEGVIGKFPAP
jgi:hypothetical protein